MEVSQRALAYMLLWALLGGALLGCLYDLFSFHRRECKENSSCAARLAERTRLPGPLAWRKQRAKSSKREWVSIVVLMAHDVLFCLLFALAAVLLLYYTNDGQWRWSVPIGMLSAFLLYRATLGRLVRRALEILLILMRALLLWTIALLLYPIRRMWRLWEKPRRMLIAWGRRLYHRLLSGVRGQIEKRRARQKTSDIPDEVKQHVHNRRPPDGKTVFAKGGYKPIK